MKLCSKILIGFTILLVVLSVSATFYKSVILQDFEIITIDQEGTEDVDDELISEDSLDTPELVDTDI
jgi:hypothetical protein